MSILDSPKTFSTFHGQGHVTWLTSCRSLHPLLGALAPVWNHDIFACGPWKECLGDVEHENTLKLTSLHLKMDDWTIFLLGKAPFQGPVSFREGLCNSEMPSGFSPAVCDDSGKSGNMILKNLASTCKVWHAKGCE